MKTFSVLLILIAGCCYPLKGMSTVPDSLKARIDSLVVLSHSFNVEERYAGEFGIAWELYDLDNPLAARYATKAYKSICEIADSARMLKAGRLLGQLLRRVDKPDSAVLMFKTVFPIAVALRDSIEQAKVINALSILYTYQGRYDLALVHNFKSIEIWKALDDTVGIALALENTGVTYYKMENWREAERYYLMALKFRNVYKSKYLFTNMALVKIYSGDTLGFRCLSEKALDQMAPDATPAVCVAYSYGYGLHYQSLRKYQQALVHFHEALSGARLINDFRFIADSRLRIAECYAQLGKYELSIKMIKGLEGPLVRSRVNPLRLDYYDLMANALERRGELKAAILYRRKFQALADTVNGQTIMNKVLMARVEIDEEQSRLALSQQASMISLNQQVINRQQIVIVLSISLLIVLLVLGLVLVRFYRFQKEISKDLDRRVLERTRELEYSEKLLTSNLGQQQELMEMISSKVLASIATIRGLCAIKQFESRDRVELELEKVATNLTQVPQIIHRSLVNKAQLDGPRSTSFQRVSCVRTNGYIGH
jgi:tetratricopeptide (TPR) repeat protein